MATQIPPELLLQILQHVKVEFDPSRNFPTPWYTYPWPYSHVCRYWRDILISSPAEWTHVKLNVLGYSELGNVPHDKQHNHLARCKLQLERAGDYPLDIFIKAQHPGAYPAVSYLFQESRRWRQIKINVIHLDTTTILDALARCSAVLETLVIDSISTRNVTTVPKEPLTLPKLRYIALNPEEDRLLRSLRLPALEQLHLDREESVSLPSVVDLLQTSRPDKLTQLTLCNLPNLDDGFLPLMRSCLELCPQLENFRVWLYDAPVGESSMNISLPLLSLLVWSPENQLCPKLHTLLIAELDMHDTSEQSRAVFLDMLASRSEVAARASGLSLSDGDAAPGNMPTTAVATGLARGSWPERFLNDVLISFAYRTYADMIFDADELSRIYATTRMMRHFSMQD